jgi:flagellar hook-associated protein 2
MPIRITGMNSGLDTESIITALTQKKQDRVNTAKNDQKKLTWKQDKWKELNKKVLSFYNGAVSTMRFSTAYTKKVTTSSNESAATVLTGSGAMDTTQNLSINKLAKSAYLTGKEVTVDDNGTKATNMTTIEDLGLSAGDKIQFTIGGNSSDVLEVSIEAGDKIEDVVSKLREAKSSLTETSLNFSFDDNNGRFFVAAKNSGEAASFDLVENDAMSKLGLAKKADGSNYIAGASAEIVLNGETFTSDTNTFEINGLTITANQVASDITLTTKQDTSGIYDNIKKLISEYNTLIKEISTLYNADKATKYKMLTDDEKDQMSDKEVEDWENKIKDGLLSGDETLSTIRSGLTSIITQGVDVTLKDGTTQKLSLASFGIATGSYFNTEENERNMLHIDGDPDDTSTSGNTDLLKKYISTDPQAVQDFFSNFARNMYSTLTDLMRGTEYSTAYTIYEDKLMAAQYTAYNTKISDAESALTAAQDKLYTKFSRMETALAKLNSNSGSLSSFFGS